MTKEKIIVDIEEVSYERGYEAWYNDGREEQKYSMLGGKYWLFVIGIFVGVLAWIVAHLLIK